MEPEPGEADDPTRKGQEINHSPQSDLHVTETNPPLSLKLNKVSGTAKRNGVHTGPPISKSFSYMVDGFSRKRYPKIPAKMEIKKSVGYDSPKEPKG
ncbi:hypothetical protein RJ640_027158 [Escallonia rubra]|uniref:Uncharacterized protein n=1 Tax=Escallonia rubra TaxID=112253 RepID=A0AA88S8S0_9ASTE|nr:hypothetical protein RJ640_027158 [Escallonia rubra]